MRLETLFSQLLDAPDREISLETSFLDSTGRNTYEDTRRQKTLFTTSTGERKRRGYDGVFHVLIHSTVFCIFTVVSVLLRVSEIRQSDTTPQ
jgi:hypothetical protein